MKKDVSLYRKINLNSSLEEIKKIKNLDNFISKKEKRFLIDSIKLKNELTNKGFYIQHFQKKDFGEANYKFVVTKGSFSYGTVGNSFYMPIFEIYNWLKKSGDI